MSGLEWVSWPIVLGYNMQVLDVRQCLRPQIDL